MGNGRWMLKVLQTCTRKIKKEKWTLKGLNYACSYTVKTMFEPWILICRLAKLVERKTANPESRVQIIVSQIRCGLFECIQEQKLARTVPLATFWCRIRIPNCLTESPFRFKKKICIYANQFWKQCAYIHIPKKRPPHPHPPYVYYTRGGSCIAAVSYACIQLLCTIMSIMMSNASDNVYLRFDLNHWLSCEPNRSSYVFTCVY